MNNEMQIKVLEEILEHLKSSQGSDLKLLMESEKPEVEIEMEGEKPEGELEIIKEPESKEEILDGGPDHIKAEIAEKGDHEEMTDEELEELLKREM